MIEVSSGEYGDVLPKLIGAWNTHVAENLCRENSTSSSTNSSLKQMMVSILPCTVKTQNKSIFGGVSQLSQVRFFLGSFKELRYELQDEIKDTNNGRKSHEI